MSQKTAVKAHHPQRTTLMTVALVLVILHGLFMTAVYWTTRQNLGGSSPTVLTILLLCALGDIIAGFGMWTWKRWGLYLYAAVTVIKTVIVLLFTGDIILVFASLLPAIIVAHILLPKRDAFN